MLRADLGEARNRSLATVLALVFALSFIIGAFFPYKSLGGVAIIFIQPTLWILGLFSLVPIVMWLERNRRWWHVAVWGLLGIAWLQTLGAFNFGHRAAFSSETANAFREIRASNQPDEVVAYMPSTLVQNPVLGHATETTNFAMTALTGLDGYVSSETYSTAFAVPGLHGRDDLDVLAQARQIYEQRRQDVQSFLNGTINEAASARLRNGHVCWVVASGDALQPAISSPKPWRKTPDMVFYRLCP